MIELGVYISYVSPPLIKCFTVILRESMFFDEILTLETAVLYTTYGDDRTWCHMANLLHMKSVSQTTVKYYCFFCK